MKYNFLTKVVIISLCSTSSFATNLDFLSVNGYGTVGGAYQSDKNVLYRDSAYADRGSQGEFSFANYTVLGLQLDAKATEELTFTIQGIASPNNENDKPIDIEWANAKYKLTDSLDVRAGLMRLPTFMFSDILNVAYYYDQIRLPDMYGLVSINKYRGVEFAHRLYLNALAISSTILYGETTSDIKSIGRNGDVSKIEIDADKIYGIALKFIYNDLTLRTSYIKSSVDINNQEMNSVLSQFNSMRIPAISEAIQKYKVENAPVLYFNLGARYDFENSYLLGEYIGIESDSFIPDITSWNMAMGYNFETWTPFIAYSHTKSSSNYNCISSKGMPPQVAGAIDGANQAFSIMSESTGMDIETLSLGFRYDIYDNMVLKLQYDEQDSSKYSQENLHIFSSAINFIF